MSELNKNYQKLYDDYLKNWQSYPWYMQNCRIDWDDEYKNEHYSYEAFTFDEFVYHLNDGDYEMSITEYDFVYRTVDDITAKFSKVYG